MFERYKVQKDDSLSLIAKNHSTTIDYLKSINDLYFVDNLREGMDLIVPQSNEKYFEVVKIKNGAPLETVAKEYNVNPKLLASLNGLDISDYIYKKQEIMIPKKNYSFYITSEGDTLESISKTFGIQKERLLNQNKTIYLLPEQLIINKKINGK